MRGPRVVCDLCSGGAPAWHYDVEFDGPSGPSSGLLVCRACQVLVSAGAWDEVFARCVAAFAARRGRPASPTAREALRRVHAVLARALEGIDAEAWG